MSEWEKATAAAAAKIAEIFRKWEGGPVSAGLSMRADLDAVDAVLSAFEREGFVLVPKTASAAMCEAWRGRPLNGRDPQLTQAFHAWDCMITAALKDRT